MLGLWHISQRIDPISEGLSIRLFRFPGTSCRVRTLINYVQKEDGEGMKLEHPVIPLLGRLLMTYIFATSGIAKIVAWDGNIAYMATRHLPFIPELLAIATAIEVGGSICLIIGYRARTAAVIMFFYMIVLTLLFHNYWALTGNLAGVQETHFRKNLAIMGGLLMIAAFGTGRWTIDALFRRKRIHGRDEATVNIEK